jgi:catechol 2,3-dioxygenase-like lactoylglutathione lyase family enzyme
MSVAAVHSLDAVVFQVPDLEPARHFYGAFGLRVDDRGSHLALGTFGQPHHWAEVHAGHAGAGNKHLAFLRFACFEQDYEAIKQRCLARAGGSCEPHPLGDARGSWFMHPDGWRIQLVVGEMSAPRQAAVPAPAEVVPLGTGKSVARSKVKQVQPRRLSHALLFSADVARAATFLEDTVGLKTTDTSADIIYFMHGVHGSDHHMLGIVKSEGPGLHHLSWDVASVQQVGLGMEQMLQAGYTNGWGVGRHVLGSNYFYYVQDPWGSFCEFSHDIDYVPAGFEWPRQDHPVEDSFYVWGPQPPAYFTVNTELAL